MVINMNTFKDLKTQSAANRSLALTNHHSAPDLSLTSPALTLVSNFSNYTPLRLKSDTPIDDAIKQALLMHTDFILACDFDDRLTGVASTAELQSAKVLSLAQKLGLKRNELTLHDVMTPVEQLHAVSMQTLGYACIGDALQTMEHKGAMFLLVISANGEICGLLSAREISRKLHIPLHITPIAGTFHEVMATVEHPH